MEQVQKTKNYAQFKYLLGNRPIDRYHLRKLRESIENNNHLNLHPIIVNQDFEIIDGQHRFEVARDLGLDVYFIKSDIIKDEHLIDCNVNQKSFEVENFIEFFAIKEKNPEYIQLKAILKSSGLKPKALLTLVLGTANPHVLGFIKTGKFKFPESQDHTQIMDSYMDFLEYVKDKRIKPFGMFSNHNFARAFRWLFLTTGFNMQIFFNKFDNQWFKLRPQATSQDWYNLLLEIYNNKNRDKLENEYEADKA